MLYQILRRVMRPVCWYGTLVYLAVRVRLCLIGAPISRHIIRELMVLVGTNHVLTLATSKQENAAVENVNKRSHVSPYHRQKKIEKERRIEEKIN